jgi:hypothetical protein
MSLNSGRQRCFQLSRNLNVGSFQNPPRIQTPAAFDSQQCTDNL